MGVRVGSSSVSCVATSSISSLSRPTSTTTTNSQLTFLRLPCGRRQHDARWISNIKGVQSFYILPSLTIKRRKFQERICAAHVEQPQHNVLEPVTSEAENDIPSSNGTSSSSSPVQFEGSGGKSGFVSFYSRPSKGENKIITFYPQKNQNRLQWFLGPMVLVTSFILPSLYLRKILSSIFEDSLLTDFLILFFTEALFYCGVGVFLLLVDQTRKPTAVDPAEYYGNLSPQIGQRISSVATLVLSLIIPMVTMGFVWPWTGPAASAALAPYLVGIVVQFAFEQYAKYKKSPSLSVIPIIFQVYRLHQLNRAAQLVTALSFTVRGAEMNSHNIAISSSLGTLLNVLQFLGVICIWSLASFIMRYNPPPIITSE